MQNYVIAVVNSTKARLFVLEPAKFPEYEPSSKLIEVATLLSSTQELQGQDLWSNTKPGRNRGTAGQAHGYDDHRENHRTEFERRFAQAIAARMTELLLTYQPHQLLLIAEPQILGIMREILIPELPKNLKVYELAKDLCQLSTHELHEYLATKNLLPAPSRPNGKKVQSLES